MRIFQAKRWGADSEAMARREARWREMEAAGVVLEAMRAV
jgi:chaperone required for assembly of F1-ATPase